ncbi:PolC-type DNA polymerase III [Acinetobacter junii]|uniref:3'-5' exonuclease n=1 Tax=Acinetobacter junii TaxID=40215 RepID=UPI003A8965C6
MYCILDLETTGINQFKDQPIEIGAILVDEAYNIIDEFHSYIHISEDVIFSNSARKTHGLQESFLFNKPYPTVVLESFFSKFNYDFRFVAWNMSFDVGFFRRMCYENGYLSDYDKLNYRHIDLQSIFFFYCQKNNIKDLSSLSDACELFDIPRKKIHNALDDAIVSYFIFKKLMSA